MKLESGSNVENTHLAPDAQMPLAIALFEILDRIYRIKMTETISERFDNLVHRVNPVYSSLVSTLTNNYHPKPN